MSNSVKHYRTAGWGARRLVLAVSLVTWGGLWAELPPGLTQDKNPAKTSRQTKFRENLASLDVNDSRFSAPDIIVLGKTVGTNSVYTSEHLRISLRPGEPQDLYVIIPEGVRNPPAILYMYSYPETAARFEIEAWALNAAGQGIAAIGFSSGVSGHAADSGLTREEFLRELPGNLIRSAHDIQLILNYLASRKDLDLDRIGVYGAGSGASSAILASAVDSRIKVLDVFNPWGSWPEFFAGSSILSPEKRGFFIKHEYLESLAWSDPVLWFAKSRARSVRVQDVRQQDLVPVGVQTRMEDAAPGFAEINQYEDDRTLLEMQGPGMVFGWTKAQLLAGAKPQTLAEKSQRTHYFPGKGHTLAP